MSNIVNKNDSCSSIFQTKNTKDTKWVGIDSKNNFTQYFPILMMLHICYMKRIIQFGYRRNLKMVFYMQEQFLEFSIQEREDLSLLKTLENATSK